MVDLHTHSNISDGELSPEALIKEAFKNGLSAIALTDHDTIKGLETARTAANACQMRFISGIEINIDWPYGGGMLSPGPGGEFHLLGLGINNPTPSFISAIEELSKRREARNLEILDRMYELSLIMDKDLAWKELNFIAGCKSAGVSGEHSLGRLHFAAFLIKRKIVKNVNQAFDRYLMAGKPLFVPKTGMKFHEAVPLIRESGGIPILAHPVSLYLSWGKLPDFIKLLKDQGLMGLEAWHPTTKAGQCLRLEELARSLDLYVTEGSDFHGQVRPDRKLGYSARGRKIDDSVLQAIPELKESF